MRTLADLAADLDLRGAFDFAIMIEEDAQDRYARLAARLADDPGGAGAVFRELVATEGVHRDTLVARREALFRDEPRRLEISVLDDGPERPDADDDDLPRTALAALRIGVAAERRARAFYARVAPRVRDPEVRAFFLGLEREEEQHAELLERRIAARGERAEPEVGPDSAPPVAAEAPVAYPDRALLEEALPRFDAATRAVASAVIVEGVAPGAVARALGVSRRTVARKLARFVQLARLQAAGALAAVALGGCAGALPHPGAGAGANGAARESEPAVLVNHVDGDLRGAEHPDALPAVERGNGATQGLARVLAQVARRMRGASPELHERVARTIMAESGRAGLDPLLVLALIHVESSFEPTARSAANAVGLMQLLEPTMRRELERSGLPAADPFDPVANVQAGVRYLRRLLDAFDGDLELALMAYNAGPNRIRGHVRKGEVPERFFGYPRKVTLELERLRAALGARPELFAAADAVGRTRT